MDVNTANILPLIWASKLGSIGVNSSSGCENNSPPPNSISNSGSSITQLTNNSLSYNGSGAVQPAATNLWAAAALSANDLTIASFQKLLAAAAVSNGVLNNGLIQPTQAGGTGSSTDSGQHCVDSTANSIMNTLTLGSLNGSTNNKQQMNSGLSLMNGMLMDRTSKCSSDNFYSLISMGQEQIPTQQQQSTQEVNNTSGMCNLNGCIDLQQALLVRLGQAACGMLTNTNTINNDDNCNKQQSVIYQQQQQLNPLPQNSQQQQLNNTKFLQQIQQTATNSNVANSNFVSTPGKFYIEIIYENFIKNHVQIINHAKFKMRLLCFGQTSIQLPCFRYGEKF